MTDSAASEDLKENARKNILFALTSPTRSPPPQKSVVTTVVTPSSPPPKDNPSSDDIALGNKMKVLNTVKTLQAEVKKDPPHTPHVPLVKPRKPAQQGSPASSPGLSPKILPPRPPPPRPPPRLLPSQSLDISPQRPPRISPPSSPMRRRSLDMKQERPKPPSRRKRSKFIDNTADHQLTEEPDNEQEPVQPVQPVSQAAANGPTQSTNQNPEEAWEVIPGIKVSQEDLKRPLHQVSPERANETMPTQDHPPPSTTDHTHSKNEGELTSERFEDAVRALSMKKKRPPPIKPPPFQEKNPPLPPKKKKSGVTTAGSQEAERASHTENGVEGVKRVESVEGVEGVGRVERVEHIYEDVNLRSRPENLVSTPVSKYPSANSLTSATSEESGSEGVSRSSTMGATERAVLRGRTSTKSRPLSDLSASSFEASFEVIPQRGTNINEVVSTLRKADEKYQDASIYELVQACSRAMPHVTSTSELPPRIPDFPTEGRAQAIHEIYTTEYTYVRGLEVIVDVFKANLAPLMGDEASHMFANVDNILAFNKGFIALLHSRLLEWTSDSCVGDIFVGMFTPAHKSMYAIYCSNYDTAEALVNKLKKRKEFEQQLLACLSNSRIQPGLTLPAYLITPVQRVTRYSLLLQDVVKRTPEDHPDKQNLTKALETMVELAHYADAQASEAQTKKTLQALKNKVQGLADLDSSARSLVKDGQVYLKSIKKLYQCILFNDLLVFAHGDSRQSKVELQLDLGAVWVEDLEDLDPQTGNEDAIEVYTPDRPYTIYTQTRNEKRLWLTKLRETIYHHLLSKERITPSNSLSSERRFADFVYANGCVYSGNFLDAKRHGKGQMTWPNKSVYVGEWVDDERCGEGEFTYNTGDIYRGNWLDDKQNGIGELQYTSNDMYRGYWKDGIRHGDGKILYANGDVFDGHFVHGHIEGRGTLKCNNGVEYTGDWKHSQRHGNGRLKTATGRVYYGDFASNHIHGNGIMTYPNGDKYEGRWKLGMRHGQGKFTSRAEGMYDGSWEEDLRHGKGRQVYPNGDEYDGQWEHNRRHHKGKMTYSDGRSYEGDFFNDLFHGEGLLNYSKLSKYEGSWCNDLRHGSGTMMYEDKSTYTGDWVMGLRQGQGELVMADGSVYRGQWNKDKAHGKGSFSITPSDYLYTGDWVSGMREGRGEEKSQYGSYKGAWKGDTKTGYGEERTLVGTMFEGTWDRNRKHGRGVRKMIFGVVDEQYWKSGQLYSDPERMTAVELPFLNRTDV